jgi:uncharacterized protein YuzE
MKVKYDKKVDALYISLAKGEYGKSRKVSGSIVVDEDKKGKILGVEILDASKNVPAFDPKKVEFKVQTA